VWRDNKLRDRQPFFPAIFFWLRAICDDEDGCVAVAVQQRVGGCRCCACNRRASICDRHRVLGVGRVENGRQMQVVGAHQERVQEAEERSSGCNAARGDTGAPSLPQCYEPQRTPFSVHSPHVRRCRGELAALHCRLLPHQRASTPLSHAPHTTRLPTNCIPKTELKCRRQSIHRGTCSRRPPRHATPRHATPRHAQTMYTLSHFSHGVAASPILGERAVRHRRDTQRQPFCCSLIHVVATPSRTLSLLHAFDTQERQTAFVGAKEPMTGVHDKLTMPPHRTTRAHTRTSTLAARQVAATAYTRLPKFMDRDFLSGKRSKFDLARKGEYKCELPKGMDGPVIVGGIGDSGTRGCVTRRTCTHHSLECMRRSNTSLVGMHA
jgi:hypothetical protein